MDIKEFAVHALIYTLLSVMLFCFAASVAKAADAGPYAVLDVGAASWDIDTKDVNDGSVDGKLETADLQYGIRLGYQFNSWLAVEAGYRDLGESTLKGTSNGMGGFYCGGKVSSKLDASVFEALALPQWEFIPGFSVFGVVGAARWDSEGTVKDSCGTFKGDDDGVDLTFGAGLEWTATDHLGVRVEVRQYNNVADTFDVRTASVGAVFRF